MRFEMITAANICVVALWVVAQVYTNKTENRNIFQLTVRFTVTAMCLRCWAQIWMRKLNGDKNWFSFLLLFDCLVCSMPMRTLQYTVQAADETQLYMHKLPSFRLETQFESIFITVRYVWRRWKVEIEWRRASALKGCSKLLFLVHFEAVVGRVPRFWIPFKFTMQQAGWETEITFRQYVSFHQQITERHSRLVGTPASYSEGTRNEARTAPFRILSNSLFINRPDIRRCIV
jgi:hypothetical protein